MDKSEKFTYKIYGALGVFILALLGGWLLLNLDSNEHWSLTVEGVGTYSSCRVADLNSDGVLDVVVGLGAKEYQASEFGVIAIDGKSGELLWSVPCRNQMVGSAIFNDIDKDGISDVVIGGRSAQFLAINGQNGKVIWEFLPDFKNIDLVSDTTLLNFFSPQWVDDFDEDQVPDILVSFGGMVSAAPDNKDRPSGRLRILSGATGNVLGDAPMPDNRETYFSPVVLPGAKLLESLVIYGSGGETINGGLYVATIGDIISGDLRASKKLADGRGKGFIAPPILIDITADKIVDVVVNSFDGRMLAFDGNNLVQLWEYRAGDSLEAYSCNAPLDVNHDDVPDLFGNFGIGQWPHSRRAVQVVVDGKTGTELSRTNIGSIQYASPLTADLTGDGKVDVVFSINYISKGAWEGQVLEGELDLFRYQTELIVQDVTNEATFSLTGKMPGTNIGSTPLLSDLDKDGKLDLVFCRMTDEFNLFSFKELVVERKELNLDSRRLVWGAYMGDDYNCIYNCLASKLQ